MSGDEHSDQREQILSFIDGHFGPIATFAVDNHRELGRGVTHVEIPVVPPGTTVVAVTSMTYHTQSQVKDTTASAPSVRGDADVLLRMIDTYDPAQQAVVSVVQGDYTVTIKIRLAPTVIVDEAPGVH